VAEHPNFFENLEEARLRLKGNVVLYDGRPYYVYWLSNHNSDGIIRVYMYPISHAGLPSLGGKLPNIEGLMYESNPHLTTETVGKAVDEWMEDNDKKNILVRKMMNSPKFNKFRPWPLGMCNVSDRVYYVERSPQRRTDQGLIQAALTQKELCLLPRHESVPSSASGSIIGSVRGRPEVNLFSKEFEAMVLGDYPSAVTCLTELRNKTTLNNSVAFSRNFAFLRGPVETIFLAYKQDIVGILPMNNFEVVRLSNEFTHVREAVEETGLFGNVI